MAPRSQNQRSSRKHVTTACIPCREGKVKCDGNSPTCRNCHTKGKRCIYRQTDDKRKVQVRVAVSFLAQRVDQLSCYIRDHGLQRPKVADSDGYVTVKSILEALEIQCEDFLENNEPAARTPEHHVDNDSLFTDDNDLSALELQQSEPVHENDPIDPESNVSVDAGREGEGIPKAIDGTFNAMESSAPGEFIAASSTQCPGPPQPVDPAPLNQGTSLHETTVDRPNDHDSESDDEVTDHVSCRLGRLQFTHDGQLRYFGSTSNLTLLDAVGAGPHGPSPVQRDAQEMLENANLNLHVDDAFERHLIELYFAWQDPWLHIIDMDFFWKAQSHYLHEGSATPYYSRALSSAMCALGAAYEPKYHSDLVTYPRSLHEFFSDRAKLLLELEMERPSIATVQALVVLSSHEASCTRDTRCWLYSGMAMRLAFDLGLHVDMTPYVEKGIIPPEEADLRRSIFWGVYLSEQFWGFYFGRSPQSPMSGVSAPKPGSSSPLPAIRWRAYPAMSMLTHVPVSIEILFGHWVSLYDLMLPLTDVLYGTSDISKHSLQMLAFDTVYKLSSWKKNLPQELHIDRGPSSQQPLPFILALHMQYYQFMIHCHRPYISRHYIQPQPPQGPGPQHARQMCIESAISIVDLLALYENAYGFRRANVQIISYIFSAALILIFTTVPSSRPNQQDQELVRYLSTCFRALEEMGCCIESARRTSTFLATLQRQWDVRRRRRMIERAKKKSIHHQNADGGRRASLNVNATAGFHDFNPSNHGFEQTNRPPFVSPPSYGRAADACVADPLSPSIDFLDLDLCNVLLSEGIPRAFI